MNKTDLESALSTVPATDDSGAIRLGGAFRLPPVKDASADIADQGRIRLGGAFRLVRA
jgi:hypothetical protein